MPKLTEQELKRFTMKVEITFTNGVTSKIDAYNITKIPGGIVITTKGNDRRYPSRKITSLSVTATN